MPDPPLLFCDFTWRRKGIAIESASGGDLAKIAHSLCIGGIMGQVESFLVSFN